MSSALRATRARWTIPCRVIPEIGEIPYSCVWTARGKLIAGDDPTTAETEATHVVWTKPERLTSGARDANLPAVDCAKDAGCILTWQEDPEGLRPGQGLGPGEGWSGAVANGKTDIWYSYISYADFDKVFDEAGTIGDGNLNGRICSPGGCHHAQGLCADGHAGPPDRQQHVQGH